MHSVYTGHLAAVFSAVFFKNIDRLNLYLHVAVSKGTFDMYVDHELILEMCTVTNLFTIST